MPRRYRPFKRMPPYDRQRFFRRVPFYRTCLAVVPLLSQFMAAGIAALLLLVFAPRLRGESLPWFAAFITITATLSIGLVLVIGSLLDRRILAKRTRRRGRDVALRTLLRPTDARPGHLRRIKHVLWGVTDADRTRVPALWLTDPDGRVVEARYPPRPSPIAAMQDEPVLVAWDESRVARFVAVAPEVARIGLLTATLLAITIGAIVAWLRSDPPTLVAFREQMRPHWRILAGLFVGVPAVHLALGALAYALPRTRIEIREQSTFARGHWYVRTRWSCTIDERRRVLTLRHHGRGTRSVVLAIYPNVDLDRLRAALNESSTAPG